MMDRLRQASSGRWLPALAVLSTLVLVGCGGSSSGNGGGNGDDGGNDNSNEIPDLPEPVGSVVAERYQPLGEEAAFLRDEQTGLAWRRCPHGQSWADSTRRCEGEIKRLEWNDAMELLDDQGFRLPSLDELSTLIYCSNQHDTSAAIGDLDPFEGCNEPGISPTLEPAAFPDVPQATFWTSTPSERSEPSRLGIAFGRGEVSDFNSPKASYPLLLVRDPSAERPLSAKDRKQQAEADRPDEGG